MRYGNLLIFFVILILPLSAFSVETPSVVINEIAWMGSVTSANDEWIELKNNTNEDINLEGWFLKTTDEKIKIYLTGKIPANGFYLLERTDENSVMNIKADIIYTGALSNSGQSLELYQNSSILIDHLGFSSKWPSGDNTTKQTMERIDNSNWQTSKNPGGTPGGENSIIQLIGILEIKPVVPEEIKNLKEPTTYPDGIFINEIMPAPEGPDDTNEWIELYNNNNFAVDISYWKLQDTKGAITNYTLPKNTILQSNGYLVLKRSQTKITLNNDEDVINLILPNGRIADSTSYKEASKNQSYSKTLSGFTWTENTTPGSINNISASSFEKTVLLNKEKPDNSKTNTNFNTASITDGVTSLTKTNPWFLFLTALAVAIVSGIIILVVKLKIFKK